MTAITPLLWIHVTEGIEAARAVNLMDLLVVAKFGVEYPRSLFFQERKICRRD